MGLAASWRPQTRRTNEKHYGRWLAYLEDAGLLKPSETPAQRITQKAVARFYERLEATTASVSRASAIIGLKEMARVMAPDGDWRWLADTCNAVSSRARPIHKTHLNLMGSEEIFDGALKELDRLIAAKLESHQNQSWFRDALMMALLSARPLRIKNLMALTLNETVWRSTGGWHIEFRGDDVKNGRPISVKLPEALVRYMDLYVTGIRPRFVRGQDDNGLWVGLRGRRIVERSGYSQLVALSNRLFGKRINPHLYRACAATSLVLDSPGSALLSAALIGDSWGITKKHYLAAKRLEATRKVGAVIVLMSARDQPR